MTENLKMATHLLANNGFGQNVVGSTNVGALPLLSKIGKVRYSLFLDQFVVQKSFQYFPSQYNVFNFLFPKLGSAGEREERLAELTQKFSEMMEGKVSHFDDGRWMDCR